jgi:hypothetical protein
MGLDESQDAFDSYQKRLKIPLINANYLQKGTKCMIRYIVYIKIITSLLRTSSVKYLLDFP